MSTFSENKDAKWKVLMFHHDIYGSGYDHSDSDGMVLRTQLTSIMRQVLMWCFRDMTIHIQ